MATTLTPNLKLRLSAGLTADARYNLNRIDTLASQVRVDSLQNTVIRSIRDIYIQPNSPDVGGSGTGGSVVIGTEDQPLTLLNVYSTQTIFSTGITLQDSSSDYGLNVRYNSALDGLADTQDRTLTVDTQGADRSVILGGNLTTDQNISLSASGPVSLSIPTVGTLTARDTVDTLTNKTLTDVSNVVSADTLTTGTLNPARISTNSIALNKLVNGTAGQLIIANGSGVQTATTLSGDVASVSGTGEVTLADDIIDSSKLGPNAVLDVNVDPNAAISGSKISPLFGAQEVFSSTGFSSTQGTSFILPSSDGVNGQVVATNGSGQLSFVSVATAVLATDNIYIGDGSNNRTAVDLSGVGNISASVAGGLEIKSDVVTNSMINSAAGIEFSKLETLAINRALVTGGTGVLEVSAVTSTELGHLSGVTSGIQTQLDNKQPLDADLTAIAGLASTGLVTRTGAGTVSARSLVAGSGKLSVTDGDGVAGNPTVDLGTVSTDDLAEGTNQFFTNERAQDAVGAALTDTASVDLTYDDVGNTISAVVIPAGVDHDSLNNFVSNEHVDHSSVSVTAGDGLSGGGDITTSRTLNVDINSELNVSPTGSDELLVADASDSFSIKKTTVQALFDAVKAGSFKTNWTDADGSTKVISHNLGTLDVKVDIYDTANGETVELAEETRTDTNTLTLTASNLPGTFDFRVLITEVK